MADGVFTNAGGTVMAVVYGFAGAAPAGQTFTAMATAGVVAGQVALSQAQAAAVALAARTAVGITVTGNAGLAGVYSLDGISTAQIFQIGLYAGQFGKFPGGGATQAYPDASSVPHVFSLAQFATFLQAVAALVSALTTQAGVMAAGGTPSWPSQTTAIA